MCLVHHLQKGKGSKKRLKFTIDCSVLVDDDLLETGSFEKFMQDKIKVNGKAGNLGDAGEHTHSHTHRPQLAPGVLHVVPCRCAFKWLRGTQERLHHSRNSSSKWNVHT